MVKTALILLGMLFVLSGCGATSTPTPPEHTLKKKGIYDLKEARYITMDRLVKRSEHYPVIFIGDWHTHKGVHDFHEQYLRALQDAGYRIRLGVEWFSADNPHKSLEAFNRSEIDFDTLVSEYQWKKQVGYDANLSRKSYEIARDSGGGVYGVNLSKPFKKAISDQNITVMDGYQREFYKELDLNVGIHRTWFDTIFPECHRPKKGESPEACKERIYRVQSAWDTGMGTSSIPLTEGLTRFDKVVVIIGSGHLNYGIGANLRFARKSTLPTLTLLPEFLTPKQTRRIPIGTADVVFIP